MAFRPAAEELTKAILQAQRHRDSGDKSVGAPVAHHGTIRKPVPEIAQGSQGEFGIAMNDPKNRPYKDDFKGRYSQLYEFLNNPNGGAPSDGEMA